MNDNRSLSALRAEFKRQPLIAMPIAGTIAWCAIGIAGALLPTQLAALALFIGTGMTFGIAVIIGPLVGDPVIRKDKPLTELDKLFFHAIAMANLSWAIAIPFYLIEPTSLPLTVGILAGAMWLPLSWIIEHWVGTFHAIARTVLIVAAWYLFPDERFVAIPIVIVAIYLISIAVLVQRRASLALIESQ